MDSTDQIKKHIGAASGSIALCKLKQIWVYNYAVIISSI